MICSVIFLWIYAICIPNCIAIAYESIGHPHSEERETTTRPLSVLLVVPPFAGHLMPFTALGEELVGRGHNVTVATSLVRDSDLVTRTVEKSGFHLWSIGEFFYHSSRDDRATFKNRRPIYVTYRPSTEGIY